MLLYLRIRVFAHAPQSMHYFRCYHLHAHAFMAALAACVYVNVVALIYLYANIFDKPM